MNLTKEEVVSPLQNSVFVAGVKPLSTNPQDDKSTSPQIDKAAKQQVNKRTNPQVAKDTKPQDDKQTSGQPDKAVKLQINKSVSQKRNKETRPDRYTTYLRADTIKKLKFIAVEKEVNDYDVLQAICDDYLEKLE